MNRNLIIFAALFGFLAVLAGTFGAHGLKGRVSEADLAVWEIGARYHMYHTLALLGVAIAGERLKSAWASAAAGLFACGIVIFAGTLYALALSEMLVGARQNWLGMVTPLGGLCFLLGWGSLAAAAWRVK